MGFRDYDPSTYRFISPDTEDGDEEVPFSQNKYLYAEGDPINNIDPDGHWILDAIFLAADIVEFAKNPTLAGLGWVALDIVSFADVTGAASTTLHSIKEVKVLEKGYETVKIYNKSKQYAKITSETRKFVQTAKKSSKAEQLAINRVAGAAAEKLAKKGYKILGSQVSIRTSKGIRRVDHLVRDASGKLIAVEVKSGNAKRGSVQIAKDLLLESEGGIIVGKNAPKTLAGQYVKIGTMEVRY